MRITNHFQLINGFALCLTLKQRLGGNSEMTYCPKAFHHRRNNSFVLI